MIKFLVLQIKMNKIVLEDVPEKYRNQVIEELEFNVNWGGK